MKITRKSDRASVEILKAKHEILISLGERSEEAELDAIRVYKAEIEEKQGKILSVGMVFGVVGSIGVVLDIISMIS